MPEREWMDAEMESNEKGLSIDEMGSFERHSTLCLGYQRAVEFVGKRWTGAIIFVLLKGPHRFNQLLSAIPEISDRLLTERLRELETQGIVIRRVLPESPVRVEYELTEAGRDLREIVLALGNWAHKWLPADSAD